MESGLLLTRHAFILRDLTDRQHDNLAGLWGRIKRTLKGLNVLRLTVR